MLINKTLRRKTKKTNNIIDYEPFIAIRTMHFPHTRYGWEEAKEKGHNPPIQIMAEVIGEINDEIYEGKIPEEEEDEEYDEDEAYYKILKEVVKRLREKGFKTYIIDFNPREKIPFCKYAVLVIDKKTPRYLNAYIIYPSPHDDEFVLHLFNIYTNNPHLITKIPHYFKKFLDLLEYKDEDPLTQGWAEAIFYPRTKTTRIISIPRKKE